MRFKPATLIGLLFTMMIAGPSVADDVYPRVPADPVQDAKDNFAEQNYEFAGIEFSDHTEIPGLNDAQQKLVREKYKIDPLNYRWKTFANVEDHPQRLMDMKRYATRYNLMLLKLLQTEQKEDKFRYRY